MFLHTASVVKDFSPTGTCYTPWRRNTIEVASWTNFLKSSCSNISWRFQHGMAAISVIKDDQVASFSFLSYQMFGWCFSNFCILICPSHI